MISQEMSETEKQLVQILKAVLHRDSVECEDDFLDIGGDSLSAMLCISRVRTAFRVELSVEDFFLGAGTISSIAGQIDILKAADNEEHT